MKGVDRDSASDPVDSTYRSGRDFDARTGNWQEMMEDGKPRESGESAHPTSGHSSHSHVSGDTEPGGKARPDSNPTSSLTPPPLDSLRLQWRCRSPPGPAFQVTTRSGSVENSSGDGPGAH